MHAYTFKLILAPHNHLCHYAIHWLMIVPLLQQVKWLVNRLCTLWYLRDFFFPAMIHERKVCMLPFPQREKVTQQVRRQNKRREQIIMSLIYRPVSTAIPFITTRPCHTTATFKWFMWSSLLWTLLHLCPVCVCVCVCYPFSRTWQAHIFHPAYRSLLNIILESHTGQNRDRNRSPNTSINHSPFINTSHV